MKLNHSSKTQFKSGVVSGRKFLLNKFKIIATTLVVCALVYANFGAKAFDPDAPDYGHSYITRSVATDGGYKPFPGVPHSTVPAFTATLLKFDTSCT